MSDYWFELNRYVALSDCKHILNYWSEFPILPRKISTYLLAYSLQDANTRFIGVFYKVLNVNKLYLKDTFQFCNKHYFSMRLSPYQRLKCTKPCPKTDVIGLWYGYYQNVKWIISGYNDGYIKIRYYMKFPLLYWIRQSITSIFRFYFVKI